MKSRHARKMSVTLAGIFFLIAGNVLAQEAVVAVGIGEAPGEPTIESRVEEVASVANEAALAGHNGFMLIASALVLFMTAPGLAMFYSGLVRKKNVLGVMMQCIFLMGLMTVIWGLWGYSLAFGGVGQMDRQSRLHRHAGCRPFVGRGSRCTLHADVCRRNLDADPHAHAHAIPRHVFHHYAGVDLRCLCGTDEIQHDGRVLGTLGHVGLLSTVPLGLGGWIPGLRHYS